MSNNEEISLDFTNGHENLLALADEARIQQIPVNLVTNAIKFSELARRMGGDLTLHSEVAVGSSFVLRLPKPNQR